MDTEVIATTAVKERLAFCDCLQSYVNERDKEPLWDGHIYVYPKGRLDKGSLIGRVPVQVKGKEKAASKKTTNISYSIAVTALRKYLQDDGLIYFVVAFGKDRSKTIFYKILLPYDIQQLLEHAGTKKKKNVQLQRLPEDNDSIRHLFIKFIQDRERQGAHVVLSDEQVASAIKAGGTVKFHVLPKAPTKNYLDMMREATMQDIYMYVETKEGVELPFSKADASLMTLATTRMETPVFVNGIKYYDSYTYGFENGKAFIQIGQVLRIPFAAAGEESQKQTIYFSLKGTLTTRITDSSFVLALAEHKKISIGEKITFNMSVDKPEEIEYFRILNDRLKRVKSALDYFGVHVDLNMDNLSPEDNRVIDDLIRASSGKPLTFIEKDLPSLFYSIKKVGNLAIRILAKKEDTSGAYVLSSAFSDIAHVKLMFTDDKGNKVIIEPWSLFVYMTADDFLCSNVDYVMVLKSIQSLDSHANEVELADSETGKAISANSMLLEIITAYDRQNKKDSKLLQFALNIAEAIENESPVSTINKFQVIKRMRTLTPDEIADLVALRRKFADKALIKCGVSIILGELDIARELLDDLSEEDRRSITDYPLYKLFEKIDSTGCEP